MRRCGRSVGQGAVFSAGKMVRGLVLSAGGHTGGGKHASTARRTPTRASCNYGILLKGIKEEQVAGFKNKKGQRMRFNEFLASQVEGLVANFKGTPHEADLQAMLKNARHYPDLTVSTRTQTCDWVSKFVEQHGDVLGLDTNPAEVSGRTPWQASTPRGYGESHAGSSQGTATGPVWLRRGAAGTSSSSRSDTTTSVSGWSDKWRRTQTRDKDSRARNSVPKGPTQFPARPNYATTWRSVEKDKGRTPTAVATVLPPDSSVRHQQEQVASGADPRFETKAEQVKQTSRGMVGSATIGRNSGRKLPAGLPAQGSATTAQVDNMSVRQTSPRGGSGEAAVLENVSVQQLHPLLEKVGPVGPLVVFDLETTGLGINDHGIVEVAAWNLNTGELIQSLINPGDVVWNKHAVRVNGISQGMVSGSGIPTWASFGKWFISWLDKQRWSLDGNPVLVAHNGLKFDYRFLQQKLADVGEKLAPGWRYLDILPWVKSLAALQKELLDNKQETLREHFGIKVAGRAHRAAADVEVLGRVVLKMLDPKICGKPSLEAVVLSQESYAGVLGSFQPQPKSSTRTGDRKGFRTKQRGWEQRAEWQLGTIAEPADADGVPWVSDPLVLVEGAMETGEMPLNAEDKDMEADGATDALCSFLSTPISKATFWTPSQREGLQNAGFESVLQVAMHFPRDFTVFEKNSEIHPGSVLSLMGTVLSISAVYTKNNVCIFNLSIAQEGKEEEIKFSQVFWGMKGKWAGQSLIKSFPSGTKLWLRGHVAGKRGGRYEITDTKYVNADHMEELGTVIDPIYASKGGIKNDVFTGTPKRPGVIARMYKALAEEGLEGADFLPQWLLESQGLKPWMEALKMMHTPAKLEEASAARRRFAAQDMLLLQLALLARRHTLTEPRTDADKEGTCITSLEMMNAGKAALPFELTCDQAQVLEEIVADMAGPRPMLRLLQGDVGTGKTAVTFLAMLLSAGSGAFMRWVNCRSLLCMKEIASDSM
ncbi:unnamed protein product [Ostreobium quekettii]|uniref:Exonuclease domain-containing protein n=1 Tax=Ostreobium quekettii TaxID=121088 RepID=A0A8S1J9P0_9CHLO|nr:unnamed protein product [Ostreobium quekettii]